MNFNSVEFSVFFVVVLLLYSMVFRREIPRHVVLLVASYVFYMCWNWKYAGLIAFSTLVDFLVGLRLGGEQVESRRKALLVVSLMVNLGLLGVFKYLNFFMDVTRYAVSLFGMEIQVAHLNLLLPVGISFYTFQTLSYSIDVYRREIPVERSLLKFAVFVSFFPQLVAGPIVRAADFLPQLQRLPNVTESRCASGLLLVFRGLFKKIIIADLLATLGVDAVFSNPGSFSSWDLLMALYGYSFQIYNDFSGYSDIAIGISRMMGFELSLNFNRPYLSQNVREFWTRWHISLSSWLRDYLYIALGGNRGKPWRVRMNLMLTMLLGGLWHGAAVNFVIWGVWHGLLLSLSRSVDKNAQSAPLALKLWRRFLCFHLVVVSWLLFRIGDWTDLVAYCRGLVRFDGGSVIQPLFYGVLATAFVTHFVSQDMLQRVSERFIRIPAPVQAGIYSALLLLFIGLSLGAPAFIYFQF
jgi:D-alanyl-lipoteichoic acid acyltransferase DltB (MBOAT superfamily)